ncbi:MAG: hypothetical protein IPO92_09710 [Saprospiraceae bacterium]|nr:hypothetical protein [Saprospiraceae bacterium]
MSLYKNMNDQKNKRKPGALKGKIWSLEDCWDAENEVIQAIEISEIFPNINGYNNQTGMIGRKFVEKWRGIIKDVDISKQRESYLNDKYK